MESPDKYAVNFKILPSRKRWIRIAVGLVFVLPLVVFLSVTRIDFHGHYEGLFLLKGDGHSLFMLSDDLFLGDEGKLIYGMDFNRPEFSNTSSVYTHNPDEPHLYFEWDAKSGDGFVRNIMPDGRQLLTCFSRFRDSMGEYVRGLFIGGGLRSGLKSDVPVSMNETGMAYYNGTRWMHVWCTINEGISSAATLKNYYPSQWKFKGSKIRNQSSRELSLKSIHDLDIDGTTLNIERFANFRAGATFFILVVKMTNVGDRDANFYYCFGDEPWVGDYGSSKGNVGWVRDQLIKTVQWVDTNTYDYAGFFDYGNDLNGSQHNYTYTANFVEWLGEDRPAVYFSNGPNEAPNQGNEGEPLSSNERFIMLQWGPQLLRPGESHTYTLAIGMAGNDPKTGFPVKPDLNIVRR